MAVNIFIASLMRKTPVSPVMTCFFIRQCPGRYSLFNELLQGPCYSFRTFCDKQWPTMSSRMSVPCKHTSVDQQRGIAADTKTTAVTIWEDLKQIRFSPVPALVFGFSGLIPFVAAPAYMIFTQTFYTQLLFAQTAYGACILSFLGGVRWGFVVPEGNEHQPDWFNLGYSVTPPLVAWAGLLIPQPISVLFVMTGIAGSAYFDTAVKGYPSWFKGLRFTLSFCAVLSLWTVFLCQYMLSAPAEISDNKTAKAESDV